MSKSDKDFNEIMEAAKQAFPNATVKEIKNPEEEYTGSYTCFKTAWAYFKGDIIRNSAYKRLNKDLKGFFITTSQYNSINNLRKKR